MKVSRATEVVMTPAWRARIWSASLQREFSLPVTFDLMDVIDRSQEAIDKWIEVS